MKIFYTGDTIPIDAILTTNGTPKDLTLATIKAAILGRDRELIIGPTALQIIGDPDEGHVAGRFESADTVLDVIPSRAFIEIEMVVNGVVTTFEHEEIKIYQSPIL